jgi:hypothetical protein
MNNSENSTAKMPNSGFVAGTLIHTQTGLKPIEKIQVGDFVLSKSEIGEQAYKRILQTITSDKPTRVVNVYYKYYEGEVKKIARVTTTLDHPFWVVDKSWTEAKNLGDQYPWWSLPFGAENELKFCDGCHGTVEYVQPIFISERPDVGWHCIYPGETYSPGYLYDYVNHQLVAKEIEALENIGYHQDGTPYKPSEKHHPAHYLKLPVYNLEVEDFHTYFISELGVWVHDTTQQTS